MRRWKWRFGSSNIIRDNEVKNMTTEVRRGKISEGEEALGLSIAWVIHKFGTTVTKVGQGGSQGSE